MVPSFLFRTLNFYFITTVIFILCVEFNTVNAVSLTCGVPIDIKNKRPNKDFIKLIEPKTVIKLRADQKVSEIFSPGCNKFESYSHWANVFEINCNSSTTTKISIKVNTRTLKFVKTYKNNNVFDNSLVGFCEQVK